MLKYRNRRISSLVLGISSRRSPSGLVRSDRIVRESPMPSSEQCNSIKKTLSVKMGSRVAVRIIQRQTHVYGLLKTISVVKDFNLSRHYNLG